MIRKYWYILLILFVLAACVKPPKYDITPKISFVSVNKTVFTELDPDSLAVTFHFEDGDGDIGDQDSIDMYWEDSRAPGYYIPFKIPFLPLEGNSEAISGDVTTYVYLVHCLSGYDIDTFHYNIQIKDRAGHYSNIINTPDIYIYCN